MKIDELFNHTNIRSIMNDDILASNLTADKSQTEMIL
jgi:hypothetical protein